MNLAQYGHFTQVVLQLAAKDPAPPTPSEVIGWAERGTLLDNVVERAKNAGVDASALIGLVGDSDRTVFAEQAGRWANAIDTERNYCLTWDGSHGWLALI